MAQAFDDLYGISDMDDRELQELVVQELEEVPELDLDLIDVEVQRGFVRLSGRVGSEQEIDQVEAVVADVLGLTDYSNDLVIDELVRGERSEAADEEVMEVLEAADLGSLPDRTSSEADHLIADPRGDAFGSTDVQRALQRGQTYEPPTRPIQEGIRSREQH
jgi:hypothetical protein